MTRIPLRAALAGLVLAAVAAPLAGCGNQDGSLVGYLPEGQSDEAILIIDPQPATPGDSSVVSVEANTLFRPLVDGVRLYVDPNGEGYRPATSFVSSGTTTYSTGLSLATTPVTVSTTGYNRFMAWGSRKGVQSGAAPLSQEAFLPGISPVDLLRRVDVPLVSPLDSANVDSTALLRWSAVPGAARYIVQIIGRNGLQYLALVEGGTQHQVRIGPGLIVQDIPMRDKGQYLWQAIAVDEGWRVIGLTYSPWTMFVVRRTT